MANFNKKWSELSKDESRAMKEKYGSRSAWQEAKSKAQSHQAGNGSAAQNGQALNNEHTPKANDVGAQSKPAAAQSQYGASTNWDKQAKGGVRDEVKNDPRLQEMVKDPHDGKMKNKYAIKYNSGNIIKNPAVHNLAAVQYTQQKQAKRDAERAGSAAQYEARQAKRDDAEAYRQYTLDLKNMREQTGSTAVRKVDQSAHYGNLMGTKGSYGGSKAHQNAVEGLMGTGQKFTNLDVQREMGSASTHSMNGLYKAYGGSENYFANHGVGSGNFKGNDNLGTMKEADDLQRQYFTDRTGFYNDESMNKKYGGYSFFQDTKNKVLAQADKWNKTFDDRETRLGGTDYGSVYGF